MGGGDVRGGLIDWWGGVKLVGGEEGLEGGTYVPATVSGAL